MSRSGIYEYVGEQQDIADFQEFEAFLGSLTHSDDDESYRATDCSEDRSAPYKFCGRVVISHATAGKNLNEAANNVLLSMLLVAQKCLARCSTLELDSQLALSTLYKQAEKLNK